MKLINRKDKGNMKEANTDTTYCKNENCINKCWRHISKYKFDSDKDYWLMECCEEERKRIMKLLGEKDEQNKEE